MGNGGEGSDDVSKEDPTPDGFLVEPVKTGVKLKQVGGRGFQETRLLPGNHKFA